MTPESAERAARIITMRSGSFRSFREIAATLRISERRVREIYWATLEARPAASVDEHRAEQLELAELAIRELLDIVHSPTASHRSRIEALSVARSWAEHMSRIVGAFAPARMEVISLTQIDQQIRELERELAAPGDDDGRIRELDAGPTADESRPQRSVPLPGDV
jgi:hypothetical protein